MTHGVLAHTWVYDFIFCPLYEHNREAQASRYANKGGGNDCGSAQHGAIVKVSFLFRYLLQIIHRIHRIIIFQKLKIQVTAF